MGITAALCPYGDAEGDISGNYLHVIIVGRGGYCHL